MTESSLNIFNCFPTHFFYFLMNLFEQENISSRSFLPLRMYQLYAPISFIFKDSVHFRKCVEIWNDNSLSNEEQLAHYIVVPHSVFISSVCTNKCSQSTLRKEVMGLLFNGGFH